MDRKLFGTSTIGPHPARPALRLLLMIRPARPSLAEVPLADLSFALSAHGHEDVAYTIATREGYPGLANLLEPGYGTFLETWDTYKTPHGAVGGVIQSERGRMAFWFAEWLCGIRPDPENPGFQHFLLGPVFPKDLAWAQAEVPSPYGKISSAWKREEGGIRWDVAVPWNTTATAKLPSKSKIVVNGKPQEKSEFQLPVGKYEILVKQ